MKFIYILSILIILLGIQYSIAMEEQEVDTDPRISHGPYFYRQRGIWTFEDGIRLIVWYDNDQFYYEILNRNNESVKDIFITQQSLNTFFNRAIPCTEYKLLPDAILSCSHCNRKLKGARSFLSTCYKCHTILRRSSTSENTDQETDATLENLVLSTATHMRARTSIPFIGVGVAAITYITYRWYHDRHAHRSKNNNNNDNATSDPSVEKEA